MFVTAGVTANSYITRNDLSQIFTKQHRAEPNPCLFVKIRGRIRKNPAILCLPLFMKTPFLLALFASLVLASVVSASGQDTAVVPVKAKPGDTRSVDNQERQLTEIYRVGVGDVLDIRLNSGNSRSTLFTVVGNGVIELPIAGGSISVAGLTPEQIQTRIAAELKRRAVEENAKVSVGVRQYLSHPVTVTGLVVSPGIRFLRREMVPLYVVLAESQLRNDSGRVVIMRTGTASQPHDLRDPATLNLNVQAGDVITVTSRPPEFYYIGGRINFPGQ